MASNQTRRRRTTRAGDATGRKAEELQEIVAEERAARANEMAMVEAQAAQARKEVVDLSEGAKPLDEVHIEDEDDDLDTSELEERAKNDPVIAKLLRTIERQSRRINSDVVDGHVVEPGDDTVIFTAAEDIDSMTYGKYPNGTLRHLSFVGGQRYRVNRDIYNHLEEKGLVYH